MAQDGLTINFGITAFIARTIVRVRPFVDREGNFGGANVFTEYDNLGRNRNYVKCAPCTEEQYNEGLRQWYDYQGVGKPPGDLLSSIRALG